ncbi:hypothetical protein SFR_1227 [Streptomyces sp. FR-008]|nr:hypothetical protein SFR_1227 [Streptomyces sp. FR-008]
MLGRGRHSRHPKEEFCCSQGAHCSAAVLSRAQLR